MKKILFILLIYSGLCFSQNLIPGPLTVTTVNAATGTPDILVRGTDKQIKKMTWSEVFTAFQNAIPATNISLQQVLNYNNGLTNGNNFQGTNSGLGNSGTEVLGFGSLSVYNNTGSYINALGNSVAYSNTGSNINAFGSGALQFNSADHVNAFGKLTGINLSNNAGNTFKNVNLFGFNALADADNQNVFSKWISGNNRYLGRLSFNNITADRQWELPNTSGTLALTSDIPTITPSALTKTDDTNVTLTLGGSPSTALLNGVSLTLGWTGQLANSRIASASIWNAKQDALGFTPENLANKQNSLSSSSTKYPTVDAVNSGLATKISSSLVGANNGVASLDSGGKVPATQLPSTIMNYKGSFNPATASFTDSSGKAGDVWLASASGSYNAGSGSITYSSGDWAVHNGTIFQQSINSNAVLSVNEQTGIVNIGKADVGLNNVDNTSDSDKPISTATQTALDNKVSRSGDTMLPEAEITWDNGSKIGRGYNDTGIGGAGGISLFCTVGYELNWQAGHLTNFPIGSSTPANLIVDSPIIANKNFQTKGDGDGNFYVGKQDNSYDTFYFNSNDTHGNGFGSVSLSANPEEGISLVKYNNDNSTNTQVTLTDSSINISASSNNNGSSSIVQSDKIVNEESTTNHDGAYTSTEQTTSHFRIFNSLYNNNTNNGNGFFNIDFDEKKLILGDGDGLNNSTNIQINDSSQQILFNSNSTVVKSLRSSDGIARCVASAADGTLYTTDIPSPLIYNLNKVVPTNGGTIYAQPITFIVVAPSSNLTSLNIDISATSVDGAGVTLKFTKNITTLNFINGTIVSPPTSATAGTTITLIYSKTENKWY